jgi:hypothetical protein
MHRWTYRASQLLSLSGGIMTLLPRLLGSLASGIALWIELLLTEWFNFNVSAEEHQWLVGIIATGALAAYSLVHRAVSKQVNPADTAKMRGSA